MARKITKQKTMLHKAANNVQKAAAKVTKTVATIATNATTTVSPIRDVLDRRNQGIILVNSKTMQDVFTNSGAKAKSNEFQTHYWAVNYRYKANDNSILDICIPTVYFNYEQEVSGAAIDFDLKDVKEISAKLEPVHNMKANELIALGVKERLEAIIGAPLVSSPSDFNSIHRHPGSSAHQSFSATDLTKNASEPGVVYPLATASDTPNFAGIMAIDSGTNHVARYEYRIATGTLGTDIEYCKGRCAALISGTPYSVSAIESLMGISADSSYRFYDSCVSSGILDSIHALGNDLYLSEGFSAFTDTVVAENLTERTFTHYYSGGYYSGGTTHQSEYLHRFISDTDLQPMTAYKLNEIRKELVFLATGTANYTYIGVPQTNIDKIKSYQEELGFTAETPYGAAGILDPFKKQAVYDNEYIFTLNQSYEKICWYLMQTPEKPSSPRAFTKPELLKLLTDLRTVYTSTLVGKYAVTKPKTTSTVPSLNPVAGFSLVGLTFQPDLGMPALDKIEDAKEVIAEYRDLKFIDVTDTSITVMDAYAHLIDLELGYYGDLDSTEAVAGTTVSDYLAEIAIIQKFIADEAEEAKETIYKYISLVDDIEIDGTPSKTPSEFSIEQMRNTLLLLSTNKQLVHQLPDNKIKEMYDKI